MDTRKLSAHIDHDHGGRIETDGWGISASVDHAEDPEMIRELVRRWNAYPELVAALDMVQEALAAHRDGSRVIVDHPEHGPITSLEEVKYLIVDPVLNTLTQ